jgi:hypothetical protein
MRIVMRTKSAAHNAATPVRRILVISISSLVVPIALQHAAAIRRAFERAAVQLAGERDGQIITLKLIGLSIPKIPSWR